MYKYRHCHWYHNMDFAISSYNVITFACFGFSTQMELKLLQNNELTLHTRTGKQRTGYVMLLLDYIYVICQPSEQTYTRLMRKIFYITCFFYIISHALKNVISYHVYETLQHFVDARLLHFTISPCVLMFHLCSLTWEMHSNIIKKIDVIFGKSMI